MSSLLSHFPALKLRSKDTRLRSGKRLRFATSCISSKKHAGMSEDEGSQPADHSSREEEPAVPADLEQVPSPPMLRLLELPEELLEGVLADLLPMKDLCAIAQSCTKFRDIAAQDKRWREFFENRWGQPNALMERAAELAGSYRSLYAAKHVMDRDAMPWIKPTGFELGAAVENIAVTGMGLAPPPKGSDPCLDWSPPVAAEMDGEERSLLFLVDGSGSVTEDDFINMTTFMTYAWQSISFSCPSAKVGIIQFSNDVRVEMQPASLDFQGFSDHVSKMSRMNGGTNISAAIRKAGQLLGGTKGPGGHNAVVLLTDGRVDGFQATEAVDMAARLVDEVAGKVTLYAFGVGRGVDKAELLRIIGAGGPAPDESHYLGLCTFEEAPWS